ncbi:glycosyl transferase family 2 [Nesterenkonia sandarakina]|uniref:Glycosyl transferase family 2 n=1 Tax=Nesterenkonia sandarakina TaxID=272918 RepID=A0A2T0YTE8_9MICC|nr:glycosyl transferase family 2 [Nesterenkonia sandarakina]
MSRARKSSRRTPSLTRMQWAALGLFGVTAVAAVIAAALGWWAFAVLALVSVLAILLGVQMFGFRQLTRRIQTRLDRVAQTSDAQSMRPSAPVITKSGDEWQAELMAQDVLEQWAKSLRERPGRLNWFIMLARETRSRGSRDVLALCATRGAFRYRDLVKVADQTRLHPKSSDELAKLGRVLWRPGFFALARVLYSQRSSEWDLRNCLTFYELADRLYGLDGVFEGVDRSLYSDLLTWDGQYSRADELLDYDEDNESRADSQRFLQFNAVNPNVTGAAYKQGEWLARLNARLAESGLAPLEFPEGETPSFFNIKTTVPVLQAEDLPLVSIIMPIYEPDEATDVAIASLLNQSWTNIEVLIMDDASPKTFPDGTPTPYREQLESWAARDSRIRLTLCEENRGAYAVRNDAFESARGEFVTVADKDDWHHPQKIERQARELIQKSEKNANIVNWVRVDEDLKFLVRWGPDRVVHPSFASIMYRRKVIQEELGYWDAVRKSADGEYRTRYEITYGEKLVAEDLVPLAFSLLGDGNLTSNDFGLGYRHPDREIYQDAYTAWHENVQLGTSAYLPKNSAERRWIGPPSFLPERDGSHVPHYDVIYLSEFGLWGGNSLTLLQEIETALSGGLKVGIIPLQNGLVPAAARRRMVPELRRLFLEGRVDRLHLHRDVTTDLVVIHWPAIMQLLPSELSTIEAAHVVTVANEIPSVLSDVYNGYDVHDVSENCFQTFGQRPHWAAQSSIMREHLAKLIPAQEMVPHLWTGAGTPIRRPLSKTFSDSRVPVVGRPWDEDELNWPSSRRKRDLLFPRDGSLTVSMRSQVNALQRQGHVSGGEVPEGWIVQDHSINTFQEYLDEIDFLLVYPADSWDQSIEPSVVEALRVGTVCIASPHLEPVYGDALVYAKPEELRETVEAHWDEAAYEAQRERGFGFLTEKRSAEDYLGVLQSYGKVAP